MNICSINEVSLPDGSMLHIGDEVTTDIHSECLGKTFVVEAMNAYPCCQSGVIVLVHLKGDPTRKIRGFKKDGYVQLKPEGIDANWFKKITNFGTVVDSQPLNTTVMATKSKTPAKKTAKKASSKTASKPASRAARTKAKAPVVDLFKKHTESLVKKYPTLSNDDFFRYDGENDESVLRRVSEKLGVDYSEIELK